MEATLMKYEANLSAVVIRANGQKYDLGIISRKSVGAVVSWYKRLGKWIGYGVALYLVREHVPFVFGLVTTVGVNYMASDFASGGVTPTISGFKFHDSGTGTTAAATGDTALQTPTGNARVSGTASNPSANIYRSAATLPYTGTAAITEWGIFSASTSGTLWDHRVFSAINVANGDSIAFTYNLTIAAGGT